MKSAFGAILRHEWRALFADRTAWLVLAVFGALMSYGLGNGAAWARFQRAVIDSTAADGARRLAALERSFDSIPTDAPPPAAFGRDARSPGSTGGPVGGQYAVLPPAPLASLAVGQSDLLPSYFLITMRSKTSFASAQEIENPGNLLEGRFDLAFVTVTLFPLLVLALSYNLLSGEREQGTLAMVAAQPTPLGQVIAGKLLVRGAFLAGIALVLTLGGLLAAGIDLSQPGIGAPLALWFAAVIAYGAFWFLLALVVNLFSSSSAANATALAGIWLVVVVIAPALLHIGVKALHPVPSRVELIGAMRTASNEASTKGAALLAKVYGDHPELAPPGTVEAGEFMSRTYAVQDEVDRQVAPLLARFDEQLARQQELAHRYGFLSPAIVAHSALTDLAGTGIARYRHWLSQVDGFHRAWQDFFIPRAFRRQWLTRADYALIPRPSYEEEPSAAVRNRIELYLLALAIPGLLLGGLVLVRLRRYEVIG